MKRKVAFSKKDLAAAGFVEYAPDKFALGSRVSPMIKKRNKTAKSAGPKNEKVDLFVQLVKIELNIDLIPEHKFHPDRKWRMDYACIEHKLFLEIEGGVFTGGRHTRGAGFMKDMEKYNAAAAMGWTLIRCVPTKLMTNETIELIKQTIKNL